MREREGTPAAFDLFVIGGGVNGCGIARDAAGRGLSVALAEKGDLASATSSASTKLFHGGLRYLEYFEFSLVRKALAERDVLLAAMPHIARARRFVFPLDPDMRFEAGTPTSRLLGLFMPWLRGRRPAWLIRLGLFLYDHLAHSSLPGTRALDLACDPAGAVLKPHYRCAYEYSDATVDDSRLVVLNAVDAARLGARILTRSEVVAVRPVGGLWEVETLDASGVRQTYRARRLVNAAGPWVEKVLEGVIGGQSPAHIRLVQGSHIIVPRLYAHERAYYLQGPDGRLVFVIPYQRDFTLIGTTETAKQSPDEPARITEGEIDYLLAFTARYLRKPLSRAQIVASFSGVRPLFSTGEGSATAETRDYHLEMDESAGAPVLHVFGGKITTYRVLAEKALEKLAPGTAPWTADAPLPGGDFPVGEAERLERELRAAHPFLGESDAARLIAAYGTDAARMLAGAKSREDLGRDFGAGLSAREVRWMVEREFARSAEDVLWRRSRLGLRLSESQAAVLEAWLRGSEEGL